MRNNIKYKNYKSLEKDGREIRRIKMVENGKKAIELVKRRQRLNIQNILEEQINKDLMLKTYLYKDKKIKMIEEENLKELEKKRIENEIKMQKHEQKKAGRIK